MPGRECPEEPVSGKRRGATSAFRRPKRPLLGRPRDRSGSTPAGQEVRRPGAVLSARTGRSPLRPKFSGSGHYRAAHETIPGCHRFSLPTALRISALTRGGGRRPRRFRARRLRCSEPRTGAGRQASRPRPNSRSMVTAMRYPTVYHGPPALPKMILPSCATASLRASP
jgi:hypothetical protein